MSAEGCRARIGNHSRRQDESHATAGSHQLQRSFEEQLIPVQMSLARDLENAGFSREIQDTTRVSPPILSGHRVAAVASNHVPRWVSQHRVESGVWQWVPVCVYEHFRKSQRPVEKPIALCDRAGACQQRSSHVLGQRRPTLDEVLHELVARRTIGRHTIPEPSGTPEIERP